ncbi:MAG: hypothetical protein SVY10_12270 [Thermodesulfobacteriota bacterium]|nr:hypothetical protein [Thermodesulfobacteriota bacterium]
MIREYIHEELNEEVTFIAGYYIPEDEKKLGYNGREVLYILGHAAVDNSCCGVGGCRYALVPGYLIGWKSKTCDSGKPISEVETISDEDSRRELTRILKEKEIITQIQFW